LSDAAIGFALAEKLVASRQSIIRSELVIQARTKVRAPARLAMASLKVTGLKLESRVFASITDESLMSRRSRLKKKEAFCLAALRRCR